MAPGGAVSRLAMFSKPAAPLPSADRGAPDSPVRGGPGGIHPDPNLSLYLGEISREPLLTREEEVAFARLLRERGREARLLAHTVPEVQRSAVLSLPDMLPHASAREVGEAQAQLGEIGQASTAAWEDLRAGRSVPERYRAELATQAQCFEASLAARAWPLHTLTAASVARALEIGSEARRIVAVGEPAVQEWEEIHHIPVGVAIELAERIAVVQAAVAPVRERFIAANTRLVVAVAKPYTRGGHTLSDLISYGNEGLIRAVESFDGERGVPFSSWAVLWIRQAITRGMLAQGLTVVRLPPHVHRSLGALERELRADSQLEERRVERAEVAAKLGWERPAQREILHAPRSQSSLDAPVGDPEGISLIHLLPAPGFGTGVHTDSARILELIPRVLDERQRSALALVSGVSVRGLPAGIDPGGEARTPAASGAILGLSGERVRQILEVAHRVLGHAVLVDHASTAQRREGGRALHPGEAVLVRHALSSAERPLIDLRWSDAVRALEGLTRNHPGSPEVRMYRLLQGGLERLAEQIVVDRLSPTERSGILAELAPLARATFEAFWLIPAPLSALATSSLRVEQGVGVSATEVARTRAELRSGLLRRLIEGELRGYLAE